MKAENAKEKGKKNPNAYKFFNGVLEQINDHLSSHDQIEALEPEIGVGLRRSDALMTSGVMRDFKTLSDKSDEQAWDDFEERLGPYLASGRKQQFKFKGGTPMKATARLLRGLRRFSAAPGTEISFNDDLMFRDGRYLGPQIATHFGPATTTTSTTTSTTSTSTAVPHATPSVSSSSSSSSAHDSRSAPTRKPPTPPAKSAPKRPAKSGVMTDYFKTTNNNGPPPPPSGPGVTST